MAAQVFPARARRLPKAVWDLLFTLVLPILILSPNFLGLGLSVSENVFGGGEAGNVRAYVLASLLPVGYVLTELALSRRVSPISLIAGTGAILSGALTFWYVDGFWFAVKDSARSYLTALLFLISAGTTLPLFRVFVDAASLGEKPGTRAALRQATRDRWIHRGLVLGTVACAVFDLIGGVVNSAVNYGRVTARFGSDAFNAQVAEVNAIMRLPEMTISLLGVGLGVWLVQQAVKRRYGAGVSLFQPRKLTDRMRERGDVAA
ncbi:hypothetical protein DAETH_38760 (plasmid) [Deinococcus aetherius]|uniref:Uncharacterized protein n=2 Tax=Deinococcus aetherius TaxID=200252 RepID=A0ABN6RKN5_9DEIO|nr:VC0807 family protein [Deinococcus aetherius]BDP43907.1 hypothetical protein DAETH_38760 [Deinococcus aetherius]